MLNDRQVLGQLQSLCGQPLVVVVGVTVSFPAITQESDYTAGLTGRYNIALRWAPDDTQFIQMNLRLAPPPGADPDPLPNLVTAFQEQLGMKLELTKAPVDVIVIDKVSRPSEN